MFPTCSEFYMEIWGNVHLPRESTETTHKQFCPAAQWHRGVPNVLRASWNLSLTQQCSWTAPAITLMQEPHSSMSFQIFYFVLTACFRLIFKQLNSTCYIDLQPSELIFDYFFKRSPSCTISRSHFVAVVAESVDEKYPTELGAGRLGSGSCAGR